MNRLAPAHMASLIMGTWFFASATGNFVSGLIAAATGAEGLEGETAGKETVLSVYSTVGWTAVARSEEHTSELQSLMRISYAVFCLKKKTKHNTLEKNMYINT